MHVTADGRRFWITLGNHVEGMLYCSDGDWADGLTALVEHHAGRLAIIDRSLLWRPVRVAMPELGGPSGVAWQATEPVTNRSSAAATLPP